MREAFSLVELSIVLVILGLLTGGILAGQSLIRAAELRGVVSEYHRYLTAAHAFRNKYHGLPGDLTNAQSFWGVAHATPATCATTSSSTTATCNGDGNGRIDIPTGSNERYRFWQHLANAGLIEGTYTGVTGPDSATWDSIIGTNVPASKLNNAGWTMQWLDTYSSSVQPNTTYGNFLILGADGGTSYTYFPVLRPEENWNIDTKIDDGKPAQGKVINGYWSACTTAADVNDLTGDYKLTNRNIACSLMFRHMF